MNIDFDSSHLEIPVHEARWCSECDRKVDRNDERPFIVLPDARIVCVECFKVNTFRILADLA
jgi:hypothetical protein